MKETAAEVNVDSSSNSDKTAVRGKEYAFSSAMSGEPEVLDRQPGAL